MTDKEKRARKVAIQREYMKRKLACETPEQLEARRIKQCEWARRWRERNPEKLKEVLKASRKRTYDPKRAAETNKANRARNGATFNANRNAKRATDSEYHAREVARGRAFYNANQERLCAEKRKKVAVDPRKTRDICKRWREKYPDRYRACAKAYALANPEKIKAILKAWRERNPQYRRERYASDLEFKIACILRGRLSAALGRARARKSAATFELLGCQLDEFMRHLETQFMEGMTWDNHGDWHIDHERPLCTFRLIDPEQQRVAFHFTNLRPLWAADNLARPRRSWSEERRDSRLAELDV